MPFLSPKLTRRIAALSILLGLAATPLVTHAAISIDWLINFDDIFIGIGNAILNTVGVFLWISGILLNHAVILTVTRMGEIVNSINGINTGWMLLRDVGNLVLIFTLLVIGVATILRVSGYNMRALLVKVIIVALLINFSLFFTKVIIDVSNQLALVFYNQMQLPECQIGGDGVFGTINCADGGLSNRFMEGLKLGTIYDTSGRLVAGKLESTAQASPLLESNISGGQIFWGTLFGSIFILVAAFVVFAAAVLLIVRFGILIFLMILSPLAFVGLILPATSGVARQWWQTLFKQAFFAPAYLLLTLITLKIITDPTFVTKDANFAAALGGIETAGSIFLSYGIAIVFMIGSLIIAQRMGAYGSSTMMSWGRGLGRFGFRTARMPFNPLGRYTLGKVAGWADRAERAGQDKKKSTGLGRGFRRFMGSGALSLGLGGATRRGLQDIKRGYRDSVKRRSGEMQGLGGGELQRRFEGAGLHEMLAVADARLREGDTDELSTDNILAVKAWRSSSGHGNLAWDKLRPDVAEFDHTLWERDRDGAMEKFFVSSLGNFAKIKGAADANALHAIRISSTENDDGSPKYGTEAKSQDAQRATMQAAIFGMEGESLLAVLRRNNPFKHQVMEEAIKMTNKWKRKKGEAEINAQDKNVMHEIAQFMEEYKPELQKKLRKHGQKELYEKLVIRIDSQIDALRSQAAQRAAGFAKL